ncbi:MAG: amidinotransferase [Candidatus Zixiibacteriota bacterium]|nr:MAG: amidinotransferase [candidate division Zixibacteria bacterium]
MNCNGQSEIGTIDSILLKHPREAFLSQENVDAQWQDLNYEARPDFKTALHEYDAFVKLLGQTVIDFHYLPVCDKTGLDSMYVHDPVIITAKGAILCSVGKPQRQGEPEACGEFLAGIGVPILGTISGDGILEGGDVVWLDERTLAVGEGYRTNSEGIRQLTQLTSDFVDEVKIVPLPHWRGPSECMHLMSLISPIDADMALVYSRLLPVPFRQWLLDRGMKLLEVPDDEFATMGCNVLAVSPRRCIMLAGNPATRKLLEDNGVEVKEYKGEEISKKGAGGPTCLTRPLRRKL